MLITIDIRKSDKVTGAYSMFLSSPYDETFLRVVKTLSPRFWHNDEREWELPINKLTDIVSQLSNYEIQLIGNLDALKEKKAPNIDFEFKTKPFEHQIDGFNYGLTHDAWLLGDSMGLGKTKTVIDIAVAKKQAYGYTHCLIICGVNGLKWNWLNEVHTHSNEEAYILGQKINKKGKIVIGSNADKLADVQRINELPYFIITNIESMRDENIANSLKTLCSDGTIDMIALDEAHKCFDYDTKILTNHGYYKIGDVVTNEIPCLVKSYNETTNEIEWKRITGWFENIVAEHLIELTLNTTSGVKTIKCTADHKFYTNNRGWVNAEDLTEDDDIAELGFIKNCDILNSQSKEYGEYL